MPEFADNMSMYMAVIGWLVPMLISIINQRGWSSEVRGFIAAVVSIATATFGTILSGNWDGEDMTRNILIVLTLSQVSYQTFWKPSKLAPDIEVKTSPVDKSGNQTTA